jgi:hypothetical protein
MLRLATLLFSFLLGRLKGAHQDSLFSPDELIDKALGKLRGMMGAVAIGAVATILATAGFLGAFYNTLLQMDTTGRVGLNAVVLGGLGLLVVGLLLYAVAYREAHSSMGKQKVHSSARQDEGRTVSPLEEALSLLIVDHVKEREFARERRRHGPSSFQTGMGESGAEARASVH